MDDFVEGDLYVDGVAEVVDVVDRRLDPHIHDGRCGAVAAAIHLGVFVGWRRARISHGFVAAAIHNCAAGKRIRPDAHAVVIVVLSLHGVVEDELVRAAARRKQRVLHRSADGEAHRRRTCDEDGFRERNLHFDDFLQPERLPVSGRVADAKRGDARGHAVLASVYALA